MHAHDHRYDVSILRIDPIRLIMQFYEHAKLEKNHSIEQTSVETLTYEQAKSVHDRLVEEALRIGKCEREIKIGRIL